MVSPPEPVACDHSGFWSCVSSLDREHHRLTFGMVCDECHEPMKHIGEQGYEPRPRPVAVG